MNRHFLSLLAMVMLGSLGAHLHAQPTESEAAYVLPWHRLYGGRAPASFSSIVGQPGTTMISGSSSVLPFDPAFSLSLPFSVVFLDSLYPAGHAVKVGIAGFLSFNSSLVSGTAPYLLMPDPVYNQILMPFWGEFRTSGATGQGIYHRVTIDPVNHDTIWTVEWRVESAAMPTINGAFQLQIVKRPAFSLTTYPRFEFRFKYDPASSMATSILPGPFGAQIGIKNLGQPIGCPVPPTSGADDGDYYLLMTRGSLFPGTPAVTRLRTRSQSAHYTPDWYAPWEGAFSSFFHFTFPDSTLKMKPIDIDVEAMLRLPLTAMYVIPPLTPVVRTSDFTNRGTVVLYQVPVAVHIYNGAMAIDSTIAWIDSLLPGQTRSIQYSIPSLQPGIFRVTAVARLAQDENRMNDSSTRMLYVRPGVDAMPLDLLSPRLGPGSRYPADSAIPIRVSVLGVGTQSPSMLHYAYMIFDQWGNALTNGVFDSVQVSGLGPDSVQVLTLGSWTPQTPGAYYVGVSVAAEGDQLQGNNVLQSIPSADWVGGGSAPFAPAPVQFRVFPREDPAAGTSSRFPHHPFMNSKVINQTPVRVYFLNNGALDVNGVTGHVVISDAQGSVLYDSTSGGAHVGIPGGGGVRELVFPPFTIPANGFYNLRAWLQHSAADSIRGNDTVTWSFQGVVDTSAQKRTVTLNGVAGAARAHHVAAAPNPTSDLVRLGIAPAARERARVTIIDAAGAEVMRLERTGAVESIPIEMSGRAAGLYIARIELDGEEPVLVPFTVAR